MVHTGTFRNLVGVADFHFFPGRSAGHPHLHLPGLRPFRLPSGILSPGKLLAGRSAPVESIERLRYSLSGAVEHDGVVSGIAVLPAPAVVLVVGSLLPGASFSGGVGHVLSGPPLDRKPARRLSGGTCVCLQWIHSEFIDVAE